MQIDGRPEFRDWHDSPGEFARHMNILARLYNEIHRDDPRWTPMPMMEETCSAQT